MTNSYGYTMENKVSLKSSAGIDGQLHVKE